MLLERLQQPAGAVQPPSVALEDVLDSLWPRAGEVVRDASDEVACTASNGASIRCHPPLPHINSQLLGIGLYSESFRALQPFEF